MFIQNHVYFKYKDTTRSYYVGAAPIEKRKALKKVVLLFECKVQRVSVRKEKFFVVFQSYMVIKTFLMDDFSKTTLHKSFSKCKSIVKTMKKAQ